LFASPGCCGCEGVCFWVASAQTDATSVLVGAGRPAPRLGRGARTTVGRGLSTKQD
jgi:hypothetical protein